MLCCLLNYLYHMGLEKSTLVEPKNHPCPPTQLFLFKITKYEVGGLVGGVDYLTLARPSRGVE